MGGETFTLGGVLSDAWNSALATFNAWVDQEIGGTELQLEQEAINSQAQQAAATAPATSTGIFNNPALLWVALAIGVGLVILGTR